MAKPIRETPILFGKDGEMFEKKMMYSHYKAVLASLERGEAARKARK